VPIFCESRIAKLCVNESELPKVDSEFEEITEGEEEDRQQKLKTKWAALDALVVVDKPIRLIAEDLGQHFERGMERQAVTTDKDSCIVNDANLWATETMHTRRYPLELLQRVITVSLETRKIVNNLPMLDID
jgi:hypothetical protein